LNGLDVMLESSRSKSTFQTSDEYVRYSKCYEVLVFHLEVIAIFETTYPIWLNRRLSCGDCHMTIREVTASAMHTLIQQAKRTAQKVIYALGLDYGTVKLGVSRQGGIHILDIDPLLKSESLRLRVAKAMNRLASKLDCGILQQEPVKLGADPEFLIQNQNGKIVPASFFFTQTGAVGCDSVTYRGAQTVRPIAELRPSPGKNVMELVSHLQTTMRIAARRMPEGEWTWISGAFPMKGFPLGGHLHFSSIWLNSSLLRALDNYLALPLMQLESDASRYRRPRYGCLGDFRLKAHGGFEYRTLPSWLVSPTITYGVLALAHCIIIHYLNLKQRPLTQLSHQVSFYQGNRDALYSIVIQLWNDLECLDTYHEYKSQLESFKALILSRYKWEERADFRRKWKI
jgi:hypothetical protein